MMVRHLIRSDCVECSKLRFRLAIDLHVIVENADRRRFSLCPSHQLSSAFGFHSKAF